MCGGGVHDVRGDRDGGGERRSVCEPGVDRGHGLQLPGAGPQRDRELELFQHSYGHDADRKQGEERKETVEEIDGWAVCLVHSAHEAWRAEADPIEPTAAEQKVSERDPGAVDQSRGHQGDDADVEAVWLAASADVVEEPDEQHDE